jgi:hypothetical protein
MCWKAFARALGLLDVAFEREGEAEGEAEASGAMEADDDDSDMFENSEERQTSGRDLIYGGGTSSTTCRVEIRMFRDI